MLYAKGRDDWDPWSLGDERPRKTSRMRDCLSFPEGVGEMKSWRKADEKRAGSEVRVLGAWSLGELTWTQ